MVYEADEVVCHVSWTERIGEVARVYLEHQRHPPAVIVVLKTHSQHRELEHPLEHTL